MKVPAILKKHKSAISIFFKKENIWFTLSVIAFLATVACFFLDTYKSRETVFFYPSIKSGKIKAEIRSVISGQNPEEDAARIVSEYLLGPISTDLDNVFSLNTTLDSVLYRKKTIYINISEDAALAADNTKTGITALEKTVKRAFPGIENVIITINGNVPFYHLKDTSTENSG